MKIRRCTAADAPVLALVGGATFLEAFAGVLDGDAVLAHCLRNHTAAAYAALLEKPSTHAWLAEVAPTAPDGNPATPAPVGYAMLTAPDFTPSDVVQAGDIELKRIYLFSRFHGARPEGQAAQRLMDTVLATARELGARRVLIGVHRDNARALGFYRRNGFAPVGIRTFQLGSKVYDDLVLGLLL